MIFGFFKKLIQYYIDKLVNWMRMQKFNLELDNEIKKYHDSFEKKIDDAIAELNAPTTAEGTPWAVAE